MPINSILLSGLKVRLTALPPIAEGRAVMLARDITTTGPDRRTYPKGATGQVRKGHTYNNGVILKMSDGKKIPVPFDFLEIPPHSPQTTPPPPMPQPYETIP